MSNRFWAVSILKGDGTQIIFQLKKKMQAQIHNNGIGKLFSLPRSRCFLNDGYDYVYDCVYIELCLDDTNNEEEKECGVEEWKRGKY